jgi:hypothetical protein
MCVCPHMHLLLLKLKTIPILAIKKKPYSFPPDLKRNFCYSIPHNFSSGRHGKRIQEMMRAVDNRVLVFGQITMLVQVACAFFIGYYFDYSWQHWLILYFGAITVGCWLMQSQDNAAHEMSHGATSVDHGSTIGKIYRFLIYCAQCNDFAVYYGPFHAMHHKYLGLSGRKTVVKELLNPVPVAT